MPSVVALPFDLSGWHKQMRYYALIPAGDSGPSIFLSDQVLDSQPLLFDACGDSSYSISKNFNATIIVFTVRYTTRKLVVKLCHSQNR